MIYTHINGEPIIYYSVEDLEIDQLVFGSGVTAKDISIVKGSEG